MILSIEGLKGEAQFDGGKSHGLAQNPGVETRLEILNLRGKLGGQEKKDSVVISSVGYKTVRMPVSAVLTRSVFTLSQNNQNY